MDYMTTGQRERRNVRLARLRARQKRKQHILEVAIFAIVYLLVSSVDTFM